MPTTSAAQHRLMEAAAHTTGGYGGVPQSVGKEFVGKDDKSEGEESQEWLDQLIQNEILATNLKGDNSNVVVSKGGLSRDLQKIQIRDIGDKLHEIVRHVTELKKPADFELTKQDEEITPVAPTEVEPVAPQAGAKGRCAGIMFVTKDEEVLLIRRGNGGDYPATWAVPGGHQDPKDADLEAAARRECLEETGFDYQGELKELFDDGEFCTYIARGVEKFEVKLNYESTGYDWCTLDNPSMPLHPNQDITFRVAKAKTETDIAKLMAAGVLPSPQMYANIALYNIRITGTGLAYRSGLGEHVWRDAELYLNQDFLDRCNGLAVVMDHPDTIALTTEEYKKRNIGAIMLPYIKAEAEEVWGIAKVYDADAVKEMNEGEISTSPTVVFNETAGNITLQTENGQPLLIEGVPFLLDHIAIVTKARGSKGVWDKGGEPAGVLLNNHNEVSENE